MAPPPPLLRCCFAPFFFLRLLLDGVSFTFVSPSRGPSSSRDISVSFSKEQVSNICGDEFALTAGERNSSTAGESSEKFSAPANASSSSCKTLLIRLWIDALQHKHDKNYHQSRQHRALNALSALSGRGARRGISAGTYQSKCSSKLGGS